MVGYIDEQAYTKVSDSIEETYASRRFAHILTQPPKHYPYTNMRYGRRIKSKFAEKGANTHETPLLATRSNPPSHFTQWNFPDGTSADEIRETVEFPRGVFFLVDETPERV
ncbi:hypothetical protein BDV06DRAFT_93593 [Aspergillus oleicola]